MVSQQWSVRDGGYLKLFNTVVCLTGLLVVAQALRARKYFWAAELVQIAVPFNPIEPEALSRKMFLGSDSCPHHDVSGFSGSLDKETHSHHALDKQ